MSGYIGSKASVTQVDGYNRTEADAEFVSDPNDVIIVSESSVGIGTATLNSNKVVIEGGSAGAHNSTLKLSTGTSASGLASDLAFYGTFVTPTADKLPRRTADITSGYSTENWGNEYLAFGVGNGGDAANLTTERMRIDGAGRVTMPYQPSFKVAANYSTPTYIAGATLTYTEEGYDIGNNFANSRFTAPVAGVYHFDVSVLVYTATPATGYSWMALTKNGSIIFPYSHSDASNITNYEPLSLSRTVQLAANDYVQVYVFNHSSHRVFNGTGYNHFSGHLIG
jgi:hypothetical protein